MDTALYRETPNWFTPTEKTSLRIRLALQFSIDNRLISSAENLFDLYISFLNSITCSFCHLWQVLGYIHCQAVLEMCFIWFVSLGRHKGMDQSPKGSFSVHITNAWPAYAISCVFHCLCRLSRLCKIFAALFVHARKSLDMFWLPAAYIWPPKESELISLGWQCRVVMILILAVSFDTNTIPSCSCFSSCMGLDSLFFLLPFATVVLQQQALVSWWRVYFHPARDLK